MKSLKIINIRKCSGCNSHYIARMNYNGRFIDIHYYSLENLRTEIMIH